MCLEATSSNQGLAGLTSDETFLPVSGGGVEELEHPMRNNGSVTTAQAMMLTRTVRLTLDELV